MLIQKRTRFVIAWTFPANTWTLIFIRRCLCQHEKTLYTQLKGNSLIFNLGPVLMTVEILTTGDNIFALFTSIVEIQKMGLQQNNMY